MYVCGGFLHKVIFPILIAILVTRVGHVILGEQVIVRMILFVLFLLPLLRLPSFFLSLQQQNNVSLRAKKRGKGREGILGTYALLLSFLVLHAQLARAVVLFLLEIRLLFDFGLVEAVDDWVLALGDEDSLDLPGISVCSLPAWDRGDFYLALVLEADLADGHAAVLLEVGPWRVDDGYVVFLVA